MPNSFDVRVWKTETYDGRKVMTYTVRWSVAGRGFRKPFRTAAAADSYRAELLTATRKGEPFDTGTGQPVSALKSDTDVTWYKFACEWVDMKWPHVAATTRRTNAEALTAVTMALLVNRHGMADARILRSALTGWGFNTNRRDDEACPPNIRRALDWVAGHTRNVSALSDPAVLRPVLDAMAVRLDGKRYAGSVIRRRRNVLNAVMGYVVERRLLSANPVPALRQRKSSQGAIREVDPRSVVNPIQARSLLAAVGEQRRSGPRLVAVFAVMYFAALRPEEAVSLTARDLTLPVPRVRCGCGADVPGAAGARDGDPCRQCGSRDTTARQPWGVIHLERAAPHAGRHWTDAGTNRDSRGLKQRDPGETRPVPAPPELVAILRGHLARFGTAPDGRLFRGERNRAELPKLTIVRSWQRARESTFTPDVIASPLGRRPYDLRHAAVSTWLASGVDAAQVAEWAGHSIEVLHRTYAKCVSGREEINRRRIEAALGGPGNVA